MNKKDFHLFIAVTLAILCLAYCACSSTKKTAEQKAYEQRLERIKQLEELRKEFPCDTTSSITVKTDTLLEYLRKDSVVYLSPDDSMVYINRYHTVTNTVTKMVTVIDRAELQAARDSIDNVSFLLDAAIKAHQDVQKDNNKLKDKVSTLNVYRGFVIGLSVVILLMILFMIAKRVKWI